MLAPSQTSDGHRVGLGTLAAYRRTRSASANRVKDGHTLGALRAGAGPPAGVQRASLLAGQGGGRRHASLFDLPRSGEGLVRRLRGQVRPSSPLQALGGGVSGGESILSSLSRGNSLRANLRSSFTRIDNASRLLLSAGSARRVHGGFGLASSTRSALNLIA